MKIRLLQVKQDLSFNGSVVIRKGFYNEAEMTDRYAFLNFNDRSYFDFVEVDAIEPGTKVKYNGENYYVVSVCGSYGIDRSDISYMIAKSMTGDQRRVSAKSLTPMKSYWFLNSKGAICQAFFGEDTRADNWRGMTGNIYRTREGAMDAYKKIMNKYQTF